MCIIVDANLASAVFADAPGHDFVPVLDWLQKKDGCLVIGARLTAELLRVARARRFVVALERAGRARRVPDAAVVEDEKVVRATELCRSNDHHVVALARVSGARTLCSSDKDLHEDFKNHRLIADPRGRVYQRGEHSHLLRHTSACGRGAGVRPQRDVML